MYNIQYECSNRDLPNLYNNYTYTPTPMKNISSHSRSPLLTHMCFPKITFWLPTTVKILVTHLPWKRDLALYLKSNIVIHIVVNSHVFPVQRTEGHTENTHEAHQITDTMTDPFVQNLFVLCHGEQVRPNDNVDETPQNRAAAKQGRPWDPPLIAKGKFQAWQVDEKIRLEGWNVIRGKVFPFLRRRHTAVEVIIGLCMLPPSVWICFAELRGGKQQHRNSPSFVSNIKVPWVCDLC